MTLCSCSGNFWEACTDFLVAAQLLWNQETKTANSKQKVINQNILQGITLFIWRNCLPVPWHLHCFPGIFLLHLFFARFFKLLFSVHGAQAQSFARTKPSLLGTLCLTVSEKSKLLILFQRNWRQLCFLEGLPLSDMLCDPRSVSKTATRLWDNMSCVTKGQLSCETCRITQNAVKLASNLLLRSCSKVDRANLTVVEEAPIKLFNLKCSALESNICGENEVRWLLTPECSFLWKL